jgi:succinate dehydrogenase / fumarate reductase membrane anchor subunit
MSWRDTRLWTWHLIAGLVVLVLLGLHMGVMHLSAVLHLEGLNPADVASPLDWRNVAWRSQQVFFMVSYVVLLGAGLYHGLYGLRNVLLELNPGPGARRALAVVLVGVGAVLFVIGTWAAIAARTTALAG